jgi:hypothetical protein
MVCLSTRGLSRRTKRHTPCRDEGRLLVHRVQRGEGQLLARDGVAEGEVRRVQAQARVEPLHRGAHWRHGCARCACQRCLLLLVGGGARRLQDSQHLVGDGIQGVSQDGVANVRHVHAQLVRPVTKKVQEVSIVRGRSQCFTMKRQSPSIAHTCRCVAATPPVW